MRKRELYRSIDNIKPDSSMKNRIMDAVKQNDKITVYKKPVFIPVAALILLVLNLAFAGSFILNDDFLCRLSINDRHGMEVNYNPEFEKYADSVYNEITSRDYISVSFERDESYAPGTEHPWYCVYDSGRERSLKGGYDPENSQGGYVYVRYIQMYGEIFTNHEYIIGYDGEGTERENMVSITESDVDYNYDYNTTSSNYGINMARENIIEADIYVMAYQKADEYSAEKEYDTFKVNSSSDVKIFAFPYNSNIIDSRYNKLFYRYHMAFYINQYSQEKNYIVSDSEEGYITMSEDGYVLGFCEGRDCEKYWKETVSNDGRDYRVEVLPDIEGEDRDDAVEMLKELGFTNISTRYAPETDGMSGIVSGYGYDMGAGEAVKVTDGIEILIDTNFVGESDEVTDDMEILTDINTAAESDAAEEVVEQN